MSSKTDDHEAAVDGLSDCELAEYTRAPCRRLYAIPQQHKDNAALTAEWVRACQEANARCIPDSLTCRMLQTPQPDARRSVRPPTRDRRRNAADTTITL
jgi:hypothetical protein